DGHFTDRGPMPRCQRGDEAVQLAIQWNLLDDFATIRFECGTEVVDIDAAELGHQPVSAARRDTAQPEIIYAALAPPTDDVVALGNLFEENRNVGRIVLQIAIHGNNVFAASVIKPGSQRGGLPKISAQLDDGHSAVNGCDFAQHVERAIGGTVIHHHDFEALPVSLHDILLTVTT